MGNDVTQLMLTCGISTAINTIHAVRKGDNGVTTVLGGALVFVSLSVFGGLIGRYDISKAIAGLYLVSAILLHGGDLINVTSSLPSSTGGASSDPTQNPNAQGQGTGNSRERAQ